MIHEPCCTLNPNSPYVIYGKLRKHCCTLKCLYVTNGMREQNPLEDANEVSESTDNLAYSRNHDWQTEYHSSQWRWMFLSSHVLGKCTQFNVFQQLKIVNTLQMPLSSVHVRLWIYWRMTDTRIYGLMMRAKVTSKSNSCIVHHHIGRLLSFIFNRVIRIWLKIYGLVYARICIWLRYER